MQETQIHRGLDTEALRPRARGWTGEDQQPVSEEKEKRRLVRAGKRYQKRGMGVGIHMFYMWDNENSVLCFCFFACSSLPPVPTPGIFRQSLLSTIGSYLSTLLFDELLLIFQVSLRCHSFHEAPIYLKLVFSKHFYYDPK